jgi:hypothetical protein
VVLQYITLDDLYLVITLGSLYLATIRLEISNIISDIINYCLTHLLNEYRTVSACVHSTILSMTQLIIMMN